MRIKPNTVAPIAVAILLSLAACEDDFAPPQSESFADYRTTTLGPEVIAGLKVQSDPTGDYVQIDDMRFRVAPQKEGGGPRTLGGSYGRLWPSGGIPYRLSAEVRADPTRIAQFQLACRMITAGSAVRCFDIDGGGNRSDRHFVHVLNDSTMNYSYVGWVGGAQAMGIASWDNEFIIAHELKHALGWMHEQQRRDRDGYVVINTANIQAGMEHNFAKLNASTRGPYDFDSIMHYGRLDYSSNGSPTIEPLPQHAEAARTMGQRDHLSAHELEEIIFLYGDTTTEWCGQHRMPKRIPPGCFYQCLSTDDPANDVPEWCGRCAKPGSPCH